MNSRKFANDRVGRLLALMPGAFDYARKHGAHVGICLRRMKPVIHWRYRLNTQRVEKVEEVGA